MRLENTTGGSSKFWEASVEDKKTTIRFGKIGTQGQTQVKEYGSAAEAKAAVDKAAQQKLQKGYVGADGFNVAQGAATSASGVTADGGARSSESLVQAMAAAGAPQIPIDELKTFAFYLKRVRDDFGAFRKAVDKHQSPGPGDKFASLKEIKPEQRAEIGAKHDAIETLMAGAFAALLKPSEKNRPSEETIADAGEALKELDTWRAQIKLAPLVFGLTDQLEYNFRNALELARSYLPKPPPAGLAGLSPAAFSKLSQQDQQSLFQKAEALGYSVDLVSDGDAKKLATKLIGAERVKALLESVRERAEEDSQSYDDVKIGKPAIVDVETVKNGDQPLAHKITAHCNWQPADNDLLVDWWIDAKGKLFDEDYR